MKLTEIKLAVLKWFGPVRCKVTRRTRCMYAVCVLSHACRFTAKACEPVPVSEHLEPNPEQPLFLQQVSQSTDNTCT